MHVWEVSFLWKIGSECLEATVQVLFQIHFPSCAPWCCWVQFHQREPLVFTDSWKHKCTAFWFGFQRQIEFRMAVSRQEKKCSRSGQIFGQNLAAQGPWALRSTSLWGPESCPDAVLLLIRFWSWLTKQGAYSTPTMGVCLWYLYTSLQPTRNTALWDWLKRWVGIPRWGPHLVLKTVFCAEVLGRCFSAIHLGWCLSVSLPPDWSGTEALLVFRLVSVKGWCAQWQISPQATRGSVNLREGKGLGRKALSFLLKAPLVSISPDKIN